MGWQNWHVFFSLAGCAVVQENEASEEETLQQYWLVAQAWWAAEMLSCSVKVFSGIIQLKLLELQAKSRSE